MPGLPMIGFGCLGVAGLVAKCSVFIGEPSFNPGAAAVLCR
jgi:hypothetical protein